MSGKVRPPGPPRRESESPPRTSDKPDPFFRVRESCLVSVTLGAYTDHLASIVGPDALANASHLLKQAGQRLQHRRCKGYNNHLQGFIFHRHRRWSGGFRMWLS